MGSRMKIVKPTFRRKFLFLSLLLFEFLGLDGISAPSSQAEELKGAGDNCSRILYCQNRDTENSNVSLNEKRLGIDIKPLAQSDVERYGLNSPHGVVIVSLTMKSPLTRIGFEKDDIIIEINGHSVNGPKEFIGILDNLEPQQQVIFRALDHRTGKTGYVQFFIP